ncbi:MAG: SDR family oxidoreductase [Dehalococcoidia bacterium]|nr:MAG: SDR family oxidoreductase [Dehalococcoidia bacterium]
MDLGLQGRVAIVSGASQGIGRATAALLFGEGCRVVIAARTETKLEQAAAEIRASGPGGELLAVPCDMSVEANVARLVARTVEAFGGVDIMVNNAGGPPLGRFEEHGDGAWRKAFDTNFMSVVWAVREALPYLKQSPQARVINITSTAVREPIDGLILSNSVRLGTTGLAKTLSRELGPHGITVNNIAPGLTVTDRVRPLFEAQAKAEGRSPDDVRAERAARIPTRRLGHPEDVAAMIVFLASAQARQVTGQTILVDGGATASVF